MAVWLHLFVLDNDGLIVRLSNGVSILEIRGVAVGVLVLTHIDIVVPHVQRRIEGRVHGRVCPAAVRVTVRVTVRVSEPVFVVYRPEIVGSVW